jgi:Lrp/AsnC family leucine-responsive transcriptional regulator
LQDNAKITVREIAAQVHLSTTPVHERIRRLEDTGVIRQYATLLDHSKVKKGLLAICYVSLKEHNKKSGARFIKTIQQMPEIMECYIISGEFDFLLKVAWRIWTRTMTSMSTNWGRWKTSGMCKVPLSWGLSSRRIS